MRRQTELGGAKPAGSSRTARLDPLALPVRFTATDAGADGRQRIVELTHERVVVRRAVRGMQIRLAVPVTAFEGIALRPFAPDETSGQDRALGIVLEHRDPALSVPLGLPADADVLADWQLWGDVLGLPLLIGDVDGALREPLPRLGGLRVGEVAPRRRRHNAIRARRPRFLVRRRTAMMREAVVHRDEHEIIARN